MASQACKNCRLYDLPAVLSANGRVLSHKAARCLWEPPKFDLPASVQLHAFRGRLTYYMEPNDGTDCLCWEAR